MRIAVTLIPTDDWPSILRAARVADSGSIDAVGLWDHFQSQRPEEAEAGGWSTYGALAMATERVHLTPMVLNHLNYPLGTLAKESSSLAILSSGRFELGIGAGGWAGEHEAWGQPFPEGPVRIHMLEEKVLALRRLWSGEQVTFQGEHVQLTDAASLPAPPVPPRVVVGGNSRRLIRSAVRYADEINMANDEEKLRFVRREIATSGRAVSISVGLTWDEWPGDAAEQLAALESHGAERVFVNLWHPFELVSRLNELASAMQRR